MSLDEERLAFMVSELEKWIEKCIKAEKDRDELQAQKNALSTQSTERGNKLIEALEFYANGNHIKRFDLNIPMLIDLFVDNDNNGEKARNALTEWRKP